MKKWKEKIEMYGKTGCFSVKNRELYCLMKKVKAGESLR